MTKSKPMNGTKLIALCCAIVLLGAGRNAVRADVFSQCPPDMDGVDTDGDGIVDNDHACVHLTAGDGLITMGDGRIQYIFGFHDVTGIPDADVMETGLFAADEPGPTIVVKEGQDFYLSLTNAGMVLRPDLFDAHTVHFHGFPEAAAVFDGVPEPSLSINMGSTFTYFYHLVEVGTYAYHCHVEATEHMQMGMLAQLWVEPIQNNLPDQLLGTWAHVGPVVGCVGGPTPGAVCTSSGTCGGGTCEVITPGMKYAYNDGDGSTYYDVEIAWQLASFDPDFHDASLFVQPLPFANMDDTYPMINGRGYPDTVNPNPIPNKADQFGLPIENAQEHTALVTATVGDKILVRLSSMSTTREFTLTTVGLPPMRVVGKDGRLLRGTSGADMSYATSSINIAGGEMFDAIIDTTGVAPGTYFLHSTNLHFLSNDTEDYGGMMTEIVINPPVVASGSPDGLNRPKVKRTNAAHLGGRNGQ